MAATFVLVTSLSIPLISLLLPLNSFKYHVTKPLLKKQIRASNHKKLSNHLVMWCMYRIFAAQKNKAIMADNFLERQYAAYEERKKQLGKPKPKCSVKFYTRPGKPQTKTDNVAAPSTETNPNNTK